ncbi:hypothetical protein ACFQ23_07600 [Schaalia naturae]|jgi:hypothetical protein|uniref:Metallothionein n=1 Tax=Schaalia naturae TaxID=635203 RepID=A0ABW2SP05_9ACTO
MNVKDIINAHRCSPQCLCAATPRARCTCACQGTFHGALVDADVAEEVSDSE